MAGMLTKGMMSAEPDDATLPSTTAPADTATQSMYHDYLTNPNSTYAQDPSLASQLKSATLPDVTPGTLSGSPATVAKRGLTPDAYSKVYGTSDHPDVLAQAAGDPRFGMTKYHGQDVITSQYFKDQIIANAKAAGMDPMEYDKSGNPDTYGARWGIPESGMSAAGAPAQLPGTTVNRAGVTGYSPAQTSVTPGMLVSGNLANIMDPNSVLMQQAATAGNQQANKRGLQNSSIGISAAQDSMYKAALPIAQQDASTGANVAMANTGALNTGSQFNAGASNTAALTAQQLTSQQGIAKANNDTTLAVQRMSSDTQQKMAEIQQANQKLLQSNSQAATAMSNYSATVANIQASKDMGEAAKQQAVDTQLTNLRNTLAALQSQSGQDLSQFFPMLEHPDIIEPAINIADQRGY